MSFTGPFRNSRIGTLTTGSSDDAGINGGLGTSDDGKSKTTNTIEVTDVDEYVEKIHANGGKTVIPKHAIPGVGYLAYCEDPQGYLFGIFQENSEAR